MGDISDIYAKEMTIKLYKNNETTPIQEETYLVKVDNNNNNNLLFIEKKVIEYKLYYIASSVAYFFLLFSIYVVLFTTATLIMGAYIFKDEDYTKSKYKRFMYIIDLFGCKTATYFILMFIAPFIIEIYLNKFFILLNS